MSQRVILMPYGYVVMTLSIVLRIKRTLDGPEIDKIISDVQARMGLAVERALRSDWRDRELAANRFEAEAHHADAASVPHLAAIGCGNQ
jgi:hypothetical protein